MTFCWHPIANTSGSIALTATDDIEMPVITQNNRISKAKTFSDLSLFWFFWSRFWEIVPSHCCSGSEGDFHSDKLNILQSDISFSDKGWQIITYLDGTIYAEQSAVLKNLIKWHVPTAFKHDHFYFSQQIWGHLRWPLRLCLFFRRTFYRWKSK